MPSRFCVLASGSAGNCAFLQHDQFGLLIDAGIGPRVLGARLAAIGASWRNVNAVVLTHTHTDHWKERTFGQLKQLRIPIYCSPRHCEALVRTGSYFNDLSTAGLVRHIHDSVSFEISRGLTCRPILVPHDSEPTFAFRIDGPPGLFEPQWSIGYAADLGHAPTHLLDAFASTSVLAIEFNHCVEMQQSSGRPRILIDRVLGERGHLSNEQGADAVKAIVERSSPGALRHLVQLHLSRDCNRPSLAAEYGAKALASCRSSAVVTTAQQFRASRIIALEGATAKRIAAA